MFAGNNGRHDMNNTFSLGINHLLTDDRAWIAGKRIGLLSHEAALTAQGRSVAKALHECPDTNLVALFGPEHGFAGTGNAGERLDSTTHPDWQIPVHSLHGKHKAPTEQMLSALDLLVIDLCTLPVRCYTYVSTLRYALEAAAEQGLPVVVADRPVPLASTVDGPLLDPQFESFVGCVPVPFAYGMTLGETALFLQAELGLDLDLKVAAMQGYSRAPNPHPDWPPWKPPSPAILSWQTALCYPITVGFEALPVVNHGRRGPLPFQILGAPWVDAQALLDQLGPLPGLSFHAHDCIARGAAHAGQQVHGIRIHVEQPEVVQPVLAALHLLDAIGRAHGPDRLWDDKTARPTFLDKLFGTDQVRHALQSGTAPADVAQGWEAECAAFRLKREECLLYERESRTI